jgi:hypothetical protein
MVLKILLFVVMKLLIVFGLRLLSLLRDPASILLIKENNPTGRVVGLFIC